MPPDIAATRILVVDDDYDILAIMRYILEEEGYVVSMAVNGQRALQELRTSPRGVIVLLDLTMPVLDGLGVLQAVHADPSLAMRHIFFLVTGRPARYFPPPLPGLLEQLDVKLVIKPFELDDLLALLKTAAHRLALSERA